MSEAPVVGETRSIRLVLTLALAGLVCGGLLVGAYQVTLPPIQKAQAEALRAAVFRVLPGSVRMEPRVWSGDSLVSGDGAPAGTPTVYAGYDEAGRLAGYAIPGEGPGFQDTIKLIFGYDPARDRIVGMYVLESRETPGLGDKIFKDEAFVGSFSELAPRPVTLVKEPTGDPHQVDAITGATISSKSVVKIVNEAFDRWDGKLGGSR
jgi:electron transport complex protein RnfG